MVSNRFVYNDSSRISESRNEKRTTRFPNRVIVMLSCAPSINVRMQLRSKQPFCRLCASSSSLEYITITQYDPISSISHPPRS